MNLKEEFKKFIFYGIGGGLALLIILSLAYLFTEKLKFFYLFSAVLNYVMSSIFNFPFQSFLLSKQKLNY